MNHLSPRNYHEIVPILLVLATFLIMTSAWSADGPSTNDSSQNFSSLERAIFKTVTFQTAANISDTLIFGTIIGATATSGALFFVANTVTAMATYFPYELAWDFFGPSPEATTAKTITRKTAAYQVISSARNFALSYAFSGVLLSSISFVGATLAVDSVIYLANEYLWDILSPRASVTDANSY